MSTLAMRYRTEDHDALRLFAAGRRPSVAGAIALVSIIAFEALAVTAAMPVVATALDGLALFPLAFGGALATSIPGMVLAGIVCDRRGPLRPMTAGLLLLGCGLLLAGLAPTMAWLVLGRIVQGFGFGLIGVSIYVAMARLLPPALHPRLFAAFAAAWVVPAIVGPAIAGLLVDWLGWRSVFLLVAALLLPCAWLVLPALARLPPITPETAAESTARRSTPRWLLAVAAGAGSLVLHQLSPPLDVGALLTALVGIGLVLAAANGLLPRGTLRGEAGLPSVIGLRGLLAAAFFCTEVYLPLYLISVRGWSVVEAGAALSSGALCWSAGSAWQARLADPRRRRAWLQIGLLLVALGIAVMTAVIASGIPAAWLLPCWMLTGAGIGIAFPMLSVLTLGLSNERTQGTNSSALQISDALTTCVVLAVGGALFAHLRSASPSLAFPAVLLVALLPAVVGVLLAGRCDTQASDRAAGAISLTDRPEST